MLRTVWACVLATLMIAVPAQAQTVGGLFALKGDRVVAKLAWLSFPQQVAGLTLTKSMEFSHQGENLDSALQYDGADGVWATVYVYRAGYPDAAIAAFETERIMGRNYGPAMKRSVQGVVPFLGEPSGAIRLVYTGAIRDGTPMPTASAFARVGPWVVKFRVSGPRGSEAAVVAALDGLIAGAKLEGAARVFPVALPDVAPCPAMTSGPVKVVTGDNGMAAALIAPMGAMVANDLPKKGEAAIPPQFPANGLTKMCVRESLGELTVLQSTEAKPGTVIVMLSDAGDMALVSRNDLDANRFTLSKIEIGKWTVLGDLDRLPDNAELQRIIRGDLPEALRVRGRTTFKADGKSAMEVVMPSDKK